MLGILPLEWVQAMELPQAASGCVSVYYSHALPDGCNSHVCRTAPGTQYVLGSVHIAQDRLLHFQRLPKPPVWRPSAERGIPPCDAQASCLFRHLQQLPWSWLEIQSAQNVKSLLATHVCGCRSGGKQGSVIGQAHRICWLWWWKFTRCIMLQLATHPVKHLSADFAKANNELVCVDNHEILYFSIDWRDPCQQPRRCWHLCTAKLICYSHLEWHLPSLHSAWHPPHPWSAHHCQVQ